MLGLEHETGAWDAVLLEPLTEDSFLANLQQRFRRDRIYTYIGNVLVSVNPYRKLALYSADLVETYVRKGPFQLPPHIYAVAGSAYRWLNDRNEDQCIIVTGESGSGKTEAARIVLQFLVLVSSDAPDVQLIKDRLVQANALLEAFGNACTARNHNASRFGKFLDIDFDFKGDPTGGNVIHYFLDKSRVTYLSSGDRNFHIFYQLLSGADIHLLKSLKLQRNVEHYRILQIENNHSTSTFEEEEDRKLFIYTKSALEILEFSVDDIVDIFRVIAVVLKLGNLQFVPCNNIDGTEGCSITNEYEVSEVCELLRCDRRVLQRALTGRQTDNGLSCDLAAHEAARSRDSLCRTLYSRLFTWLVNRINQTIKGKRTGKQKVLGVIDFYGFEVLDRNAFEQLIINYCNEKLQQFIINATLKEEQEEIMREGIEWTRIEYFNNVVICELLEEDAHGILAMLDEPRVHSDPSYLTRLIQCCAGHSHCQAGDVSLPLDAFQIRHYAGTVTYRVESFVEKNRDELPRDLSRAMFRCERPLLQTLFPEGNPKRAAGKRPVSKALQIRVSLDALVKGLGNRQCHYVRCLKPNDNKQAKLFEMSLVQRQVRYLCLIPTTQLARSGYTHRLTYPAFLHRYRMLCPHTWPRWRGSPAEGTALVVRGLPVPAGEFTFGRTRLFVRSPRTVHELEEFRRARLRDLATLLQSAWRGFRARGRYRRMKRAQRVIAAAWRSWRELKYGIPFKGRQHLWCLYHVAREEYRILKHRKQVEWAARIIQRHYIQWKRRQYFEQLPHRLPSNSNSPISWEWPDCHRRVAECSALVNRIHHRWRCHRYRLRFDQTARNRMREKVTASFIFKDRKCSYPRSVSHPFLGDYVRLRQNIQWKKLCSESNDQYVVFADIINKIARSSGKFVPILLVISTRSMLILDQRTLQIKYRVPAAEIYRMSLSPFPDDVVVVHVRACPVGAGTPETSCTPSESTGCLFQSDLSKKKGDFVFQTGHVIEIVTKLFLVVQNATGKPPEINVTTEFEANFGAQTVTFTFKCAGVPETIPGQIRVVRKGNRMEVVV